MVILHIHTWAYWEFEKNKTVKSYFIIFKVYIHKYKYVHSVICSTSYLLLCTGCCVSVEVDGESPEEFIKSRMPEIEKVISQVYFQPNKKYYYRKYLKISNTNWNNVC